MLSATNFGGRSTMDPLLRYDTAGSIRFKTGIGSYVYPLAGEPRPHMLMAIPASFSTLMNSALMTCKPGSLLRISGRPWRSSASMQKSAESEEIA